MAGIQNVAGSKIPNTTIGTILLMFNLLKPAKIMPIMYAAGRRIIDKVLWPIMTSAVAITASRNEIARFLIK